jgi:superfamily II DNA/RNA helicase
MPDTSDAYTHRIGRTGRAAKTGDAFTFITPEDEAMVRSIERVLGEKVERRTLKGFDYHKAEPARDTEFARPPQRQRRRDYKKPEPSRSGKAATPAQTSHRGERGKERKAGSPIGQRPAHHGDDSRGPAPRPSAGSAIQKFRPRRPVSGR